VTDELRNTLLIVDDEAEMVDALADELQVLGYRTLVARSAMEAAALLASETITAVLCDITMPVISGLDLLAEVRAAGNNIPFVILTGFDTSGNLHRAISLGAVEFLEKPHDPEKLSKAVVRALEIGRIQSRISEKIGLLTESHPEGAALAEGIERDKRRIGLIQALSSKGDKN
jgi:DNA-binding NtrC family response regulator